MDNSRRKTFKILMLSVTSLLLVSKQSFPQKYNTKEVVGRNVNNLGDGMYEIEGWVLTISDLRSLKAMQ